MKLKFWLTTTALLGGAHAQVFQQVTPQQALSRLFTSPKIQADWFAPEFLRQVALSQVQTYLDGYKQQGGALLQVTASGSNFNIELEKSVIVAAIHLNPKGQIDGLLFRDVRPKTKDLKEALKGFFALPGKFSVLVTKNGQVVQEAGSKDPLAVASTFKLAVVAALQEQVQEGKIKWNNVLELQAQDFSFSSPVLQGWYAGAAFTLESLAGAMVSQSDNTATDALIRFLGREAIEKHLPERNRPLLTTKNLFALRDPAFKADLDAFLAGNLQQKLEVLKKLDAVPYQQLQPASTPGDLRAEWLMTSGELCQLIQQVKDVPLTQINPGVATPTDWKQVSYKGGSEAGVLSLTTALQDAQGNQYCVTATWNHTQALGEDQFTQLYFGLLKNL